MTVAALYVETNGVYFGLDGVDPWDEARDARLYDGPWPVVAHPPCARWCQLAGLVQHVYGYKIGDDGGTFAAALTAVRRFGGVLEHPAYSLAWPRFDLPRPARGVWTRSLLDDGWVTEISQSAYGLRVRKRTWLYAVGCELPLLDVRDVPGDMRVSYAQYTPGADAGKRQGHGRSSASPLAFRDVLLDMARSARLPERVT